MVFTQGDLERFPHPLTLLSFQLAFELDPDRETEVENFDDV